MQKNISIEKLLANNTRTRQFIIPIEQKSENKLKGIE